MVARGEFTKQDLSNLAGEVVPKGAARIDISHRPNAGPDYLQAFIFHQDGGAVGEWQLGDAQLGDAQLGDAEIGTLRALEAGAVARFRTGDSVPFDLGSSLLFDEASGRRLDKATVAVRS